MNKYTILCIDDEREILDTVLSDLEPFEVSFDIEAAESVDEAKEIFEELKSEGREIALILCDHIMPGTLGVDFLVELNNSEDTNRIQKVLLTGQADLEATIKAINNGGLDYYIEKPWKAELLVKVVKEYLTNFIISYDDNLEDYLKVLDKERLFKEIHGS